MLPNYAIDTYCEVFRGLEWWRQLFPSLPPQRSLNPLPPETEYVFIDFNAWEFNASDEMWAAMIRSVYHKVEIRMDYKNARMGRESSVGGKSLKHIWRVKRALKMLSVEFNGLDRLRAFFFVFSVIFVGLVAILFLCYFYCVSAKQFELTGIYATLFSHICIVGNTGISLFRFSEVSRGDAIYSQAVSIKDEIGLLASVRAELLDLFDFINNDFREITNIQLRLVIFVDDLDRCLGSRCVKMLEAIHLLLQIPGAPVIIFLAIDSRVIVASIEKHLNKSLRLEDAVITGWEYLDKIVQIPFCIPEVFDVRAVEYLKATVMQSVKPAFLVILISDIKRRLRYGNVNAKWWLNFPTVSFVDYDRREFHECSVSVDEFNESFDSVDEGNIQQKLAAFFRMVKWEWAENADNFNRAKELFTRVTVSENHSVPPRVINGASTEPTATGGEEQEISVELPQPSIDSVAPNLTDRNSDKIVIRSFCLPINVIHHLSKYLEGVSCNPRGMKHVVNLLQIVVSIGQRRDVEDSWWQSFLIKCTYWLFLCQHFPFRMSALVQILLDFEQKNAFNGIKIKVETVEATTTEPEVNIEDTMMLVSTDATYLYTNPNPTSGENKGPVLPEPKIIDSMSAYRFYMDHVDMFIQAFSKSAKFCRIDGDPEEFAFLLRKTNSADGGLTVEDVLGPLTESDGRRRDRNKSLLSFSFNLDPALRIEVMVPFKLGMNF